MPLTEKLLGEHESSINHRVPGGKYDPEVNSYDKGLELAESVKSGIIPDAKPDPHGGGAEGSSRLAHSLPRARWMLILPTQYDSDSYQLYQVLHRLRHSGYGRSPAPLFVS
jgi:hypothetical protein